MYESKLIVNNIQVPGIIDLIPEQYNLIKKLLEHPFLEDVQFSLEKDMGNYKQGDLFSEDFYNGQAIKSSPLACGGYWNEFSVMLTAIDRRPQLT